MQENKHKTVLLEKTINELNILPASVYVDATLGGGGHATRLTKQLLEKQAISSELHLFDLDKDAWERFQGRVKAENISSEALKNLGLEIVFHNKNFKEIKDTIATDKPIYGIIADLGLSQNQLEFSEKGLTYKKQEELDMRYDLSLSATAADLLNALSKKHLTKMFSQYGDIKQALKLAEKIVDTRKSFHIQTTYDLNQIISRAKLLDETAKIYQALRIAVNLEYQNLEMFIDDSYKLLSSGGKLLIISFHSGEEKIITNFIKQNRLKEKTKIHIPSKTEVEKNPRSRSAKLYVIQK